jgi:hypothetical protein
MNECEALNRADLNLSRHFTKGRVGSCSVAALTYRMDLRNVHDRILGTRVE